jgi:SAM-dependent methyltransferase
MTRHVPKIDTAGIQSEVGVDAPQYAERSQRRFAATLHCVSTLVPPVLDLGPPNAMARLLAARFNVEIVNTGQHDLDREPLSSFCSGPYATITAFEILEHLLNPLFVLEGCRLVLRPGGVLYVSVPRRSAWEWLYGKCAEHFHEFAGDELRWVIEKAGFDVVRWTELRTTEMAVGIRPLLRRLRPNLFFVECRPR